MQSTIPYLLPLEDMVWSYSRISTFDDCPYRFFLKYIYECDEGDRFYASFGSLVHSIIERWYRGELDKDGMLDAFLREFPTEVKGIRPQESTVAKYISGAISYFKTFSPFRFKMIDVEKEVHFLIGNLKFTGFIDFLGEEDGEPVIVDNKSRGLSPRSGRKKPTQKDMELDKMLRQLYIYAEAVRQEYGKFPKLLCFNCYRTGTFIEEPFNEDAYNETIDWVNRKVSEIKKSLDFLPRRDFYACKYICGVSESCEYNDLEIL